MKRSSNSEVQLCHCKAVLIINVDSLFFSFIIRNIPMNTLISSPVQAILPFIPSPFSSHVQTTNAEYSTCSRQLFQSTTATMSANAPAPTPESYQAILIDPFTKLPFQSFLMPFLEFPYKQDSIMVFIKDDQEYVDCINKLIAMCNKKGIPCEFLSHIQGNNYRSGAYVFPAKIKNIVCRELDSILTDSYNKSNG